jgi:hypothetical protein
MRHPQHPLRASARNALSLSAIPERNTVFVPFPKLTLKVFHVGEGLEVFTSEKTATQPAQIQLRHPIVQTQNIQVTLTTGAGHSAIGVQNEHFDFLLERATVKLDEHLTLENTPEFFPVLLGFFTYEDDHGMRQCGAGEFNAVLAVEAAVAGTQLEFAADMFVSTATEPTTTVKVCFVADETLAWREGAKKWLEVNAALVQTLKSRTVSKPDVIKQLATFRQVRLQKMCNVMRGMYGTVSDPVNLNELMTMTDMSAWMNVADVTQTCGMTEAFGLIPGIRMKNAMLAAECALYAVAQVCASYEPMGLHGEQTITTSKFTQFVQQSLKPVAGAQALAARNLLYRDVIDHVQDTLTGPLISGILYTPDEGFQFAGKSVLAKKGNAEKMDLAFGGPWVHFANTQKEYTKFSVEIARLMTERKIIEFMVGTPNQAELLAKNEEGLCSMHKGMAKMVKEVNDGGKDCEDGAYWLAHMTKTLSMCPDETFEAVKPHIGKGLLNLSSMFPEGTGSVEELHVLVRSALRLVSEAMKHQSVGADGATFSYEACFGLASAPSLKLANVVGGAEKKTVTREDCKSFAEYLGAKFPPMAGHCFTGKVKTRLVQTNADGSTLALKEMEVGNLMESTVSNVRPRYALGANGLPVTLANKHVLMSMGGLCHGLSDMPHLQASEAICEATVAKLDAELGKELQLTKFMFMERGAPFYNLFVHFGDGQAVVGELAVDGKTTQLSASATADALRSSLSNASFCNSAVAWEGCTGTKKTSSVVIGVPLAPEEQRRLSQLAHELAPIHSMTKEQLAFFMEDMGHEINVGFEGGKFVGMDYSGTRIDSDTRIAHAFAVHLTPLAKSMREWWDPKTNVNALIQSKVQAVLPGACVRVHAIAKDLRVMQVVFDVHKAEL